MRGPLYDRERMKLYGYDMRTWNLSDEPWDVRNCMDSEKDSEKKVTFNILPVRDDPITGGMPRSEGRKC